MCISVQYGHSGISKLHNLFCITGNHPASFSKHSFFFCFFFQSKHKMCTGFKWSLLNSRYLNVLWYTFTFYFADDIIQVPWTVCLHWWIFILTQTGSNGPKKMRKKDLAQFVCRWHLLWYLVIDAIQTFLSMTSSVQILFQSPYLW